MTSFVGTKSLDEKKTTIWTTKDFRQKDKLRSCKKVCVCVCIVFVEDNILRSLNPFHVTSIA